MKRPRLPGVLGRIIRPRRERPGLLRPPVPVPTTLPGHPLDHDRDGRPGGSMPASARDLDELRAEAARLGIKVDGRWGARRLRAAIGERSA